MTAEAVNNDTTIVLLVMGGTGILSVLVCTVAVLLVVSLCYIKQFTFRLAMYQVLAALFYSISISLVLLLVDNSEDSSPSANSSFANNTCKAVAVIIHYFMWVKLLTTFCLSFHLLYCAVFLNLKRSRQKLVLGLEFLYISVSLLVPIFPALLPLIHDTYGYVGDWCYITNKAYLYIMYGLIIVFLFINSIITGVTIVSMVKQVWNNKKDEFVLFNQIVNPKVDLLKQISPLLAYPIIYMLLLLLSMIDRMYEVIAGNQSFGLTMTNAIASSLMGAFAGLALLIHLSYVFYKKRSEGPQPKLYVQTYSSYGHVRGEAGSTSAETRYIMPDEFDSLSFTAEEPNDYTQSLEDYPSD